MSSLFVFIVSLLICALALMLERMVGINWDFHPDVVTYTTEYLSVTEQGWVALPNQLYYFVASWVDGSVAALITLNIIAYSTTNLIIAKAYFNYRRNNERTTKVSINKWLLLGWLLFTPYRLHLAIHGLKDSFIILSLCAFAYYYYQNRTIYSCLGWVPLLLLRIYSFFYVLLFIRSRRIVLGIMLIVLAITVVDSSLLDLLQERNEIDMRGRDFDTIPSFSDFGLLGTLLRMVVWPLFLVSGAFAVVSPALLFIPVAIEAVLSRFWSRRVFGHWGLTLGLILCLMVIAALVNSFTAYIRYVYPVLIVAPLIMMQKKAQ